MLHTETVEKGTLDLIKTLMQDEVLNQFYLVGGTALALKIGHRSSIDIDLFSTNDFNADAISKFLSQKYNVTRLNIITNGVFCFVNNIKLDLLAHKYQLLKDPEVVGNIRMLSSLDIGAMKLNAIYGNGTRLKDFVDIYALLEYFCLQDLCLAAEKKYPEYSVHRIKKTLLYFDDIDFTVPIDFIGSSVEWKLIQERLISAVANPYSIFK